VKPFRLSPDADHDLDLILAYLEGIPYKPRQTIAAAIQKALFSIASFPNRGVMQSELTRLAGEEVRSRLVHSYRIIYKVGSGSPEIMGVLHTSRDIAGTIARRLQ
jgi:plasmid stabilization system protein ParE